ncbi:hypothetical protein [Halorubrum sp. Ea1]|uniref:hypothetical protein n=1 Tax=Halorubrum sp. Ea1 TaxID=1480718 RepID=UPI00113FE98F|nr:hypothetical protein [Halorubrum sp. Ea1]
MSFTEWVSESLSHLQAENRSLPSRIARPLYYVYVGALLSVTKRYRWGTNVFDREWDLLVILDACRVDALREVADEYGFIGEVGSMTSVGSTSFEWMNHTFDNEHKETISRTAYVTGNTYTQRVLAQDGDTGHAAMPFGPRMYDVVGPDGFGYLEELWKAELSDDSDWVIGYDDEKRRSPHHTTDRAIAAGRTVDADRHMVHYMYPHDPFPLAEPELFEPFDPLRAGDVSKDVVWERYLDNLRFVLDEVEILLENFDADDVAITADHGEAFGEYGFYRHVIGCPLPCMRHVPWVETTASDTGTYESEAPDSTVGKTASEKDRLEQLGYL